MKFLAIFGQQERRVVRVFLEKNKANKKFFD